MRMVSPVYKGGYGANTILAVAPDGESLAFSSLGAFAGAPASSGEAVNHYLARRDQAHSEWSTVASMPPASVAPAGHQIVDYTPSLDHTLSLAVFGSSAGVGTYSSPESGFLIHSTATPDTAEYFELAGLVLKNPENQPLSYTYNGASRDFSHVLFATAPLQPRLLPEAEPAREQLYDLATGTLGAEPALRLLAVGNNLGPNGAPELIDPYCPALLGSASGGESKSNAVADEGRVIFFTTNANRTETIKCDATDSVTAPLNPAILYARFDGEKTVKISTPIAATCVAPAPCSSAPQARAEFQGASEDGSRVFFTTRQPLVSEDTDEGNDLYMAELGCAGGGACSAGQREVISLERVSRNVSIGEAAEVLGVVAIPADASRVYLVARGVLSNVPGPGGNVPVAGADNFYMYDKDSTDTAFIGELCSGPGTSGSVPDSTCPLTSQDDAGLWSSSTPEAQLNDCAAASAGCVQGRYMVFGAVARLLPSDTDTAMDVYRYDAVEGTLVRVSEGENGYDANGNDDAFDASVQGNTRNDPSVFEQTDMPVRAISENGSRIVFTTAAPLSEQVSNGLVNAYEWEDGATGGRVSLVSTGVSTERVDDVVISPSGRDIFFVTSQGLVGQDGDGAPDVYDARMGGGFPPAPAPSKPCEGDGCQGPLTNPAPLLVPGSVVQPPGDNVPQVKKPVKKAKLKRSRHKRKNSKVSRRRKGRDATTSHRVTSSHRRRKGGRD